METATSSQRKIIHVDMDAFYASVEQRDNPELKGKPLAVGGGPERGVVAAASYEARKFGIHSAMPSAVAYRRCPQIIFVRPNFDKYKAVSDQIREIFFRYTDLVEPLSLDEAYLDVTENKRGIETATRIARQIRQDIWEETQLTSSAGISINKFLAKVASDINKPNGQKTIMRDEVIPFLEQLPISKFYGIGAKTAERMHRLGIHNGADLKSWDLALLTREFGKSGMHFYQIVRGIHKSSVKPNRERKSLGAEKTFERDVLEVNELREALLKVFERLKKRLDKNPVKAKTISLKLKTKDFDIHTRSFTPEQGYIEEADIWPQAWRLLDAENITTPLRLLGISLSNFGVEESRESGLQLTLDF